MFPFHRRGLVSFQVTNDEENPSNTSQTYINHQTIEQDNVSASSNVPIPPPPPPLQYYHEQLLEHNDNYVVGNCQNTRKGRLRNSVSVCEEVSNANTKEDEFSTEDAAAKKRTMHREIERQRRQEMANLYSSLRSLLPIEYIKGKRSICDHITEAARYIKDLEKNVKELGDKRDKLKDSSSSSLDVRLSGDSNVGCSSSCTSSSRSDCNVSIQSFSSSIEIEISSPIGDEDAFPLSRVLAVLIGEGLSIVSCVSSKVNQRWIHIIHCEVTDGTLIDANQLQWRLTSEIRSYES
uniref:BHLH domain-containing protein n=2 Tax=Opuntia streptacantha TaxID=393608 RepID=A0A7C8ZWA1_OPUST